jgi:hypothetical protein
MAACLGGKLLPGGNVYSRLLWMLSTVICGTRLVGLASSESSF